jgi:hypothetical protein
LMLLAPLLAIFGLIYAVKLEYTLPMVPALLAAFAAGLMASIGGTVVIGGLARRRRQRHQRRPPRFEASADAHIEDAWGGGVRIGSATQGRAGGLPNPVVVDYRSSAQPAEATIMLPLSYKGISAMRDSPPPAPRSP